MWGYFSISELFVLAFVSNRNSNPDLPSKSICIFLLKVLKGLGKIEKDLGILSFTDIPILWQLGKTSIPMRLENNPYWTEDFTRTNLSKILFLDFEIFKSQPRKTLEAYDPFFQVYDLLSSNKTKSLEFSTSFISFIDYTDTRNDFYEGVKPSKISFENETPKIYSFKL